jgi:cellulase/cellobiase CelA1
LTVEDMKDNRYYELWTSSSAGGPWTQVAEKWAYRGNIVYNADNWTTSVSHGDIIRAGTNQKLEINDINRVDFLIQGTTNLSGAYQQIPWDLGVIHNYTGTNPTPTNTPAPTNTPVRTPTPVTPTATPQPGTPTPVPPTPGTGSACKVTYAVSSQWTGGFSTNVTIANTGSSTINGWSLKFTFPASGQAVSSGWSATWTQSGLNVTATNLDWNKTIAPGTSTSLGFNGAWTSSNPVPASFTLNGVTCSKG